MLGYTRYVIKICDTLYIQDENIPGKNLSGKDIKTAKRFPTRKHALTYRDNNDFNGIVVQVMYADTISEILEYVAPEELKVPYKNVIISPVFCLDWGDLPTFSHYIVTDGVESTTYHVSDEHMKSEHLTAAYSSHCFNLKHNKESGAPSRT